MAFNAFDFLQGVPEFDGRTEDLVMFTKHVEEIRKFVDPSLLLLFDLMVRNKILSKANIALINNNNPSKWNETKVLLKIYFNISESVESIVNKIKVAEFRNDVGDFYEYMLKLLTKLNLKTNKDIEASNGIVVKIMKIWY